MAKLITILFLLSVIFFISGENVSKVMVEAKSCTAPAPICGSISDTCDEYCFKVFGNLGGYGKCQLGICTCYYECPSPGILACFCPE